jgi:hypothetical protein
MRIANACFGPAPTHDRPAFAYDRTCKQGPQRGFNLGSKNGGSDTSNCKNSRHSLLRNSHSTDRKEPKLLTAKHHNEATPVDGIDGNIPISGADIYANGTAFRSIANNLKSSSPLEDDDMTIGRFQKLNTLLDFTFIILQVIGYLLVVLILLIIAFRVYDNHLQLTEILDALKLK